MPKRKPLPQYIHKQDRNLFITPVDQHFCQVACVKTFASGSIWNEYDHHKLPDTTAFYLFFDYERCDGEHSMRAYKEQNSGVLIMETGLWNYELKCFDDNLSVFQTRAEEDRPIEFLKEEYHFVVTQAFSIRGFDDLGRIAHNLICIPKGTKFTWVKEDLELTNPSVWADIPVWHMTSVRNSEIGIEIDLPTKYIGLVMKPIENGIEMPEDITPYPHYTSCLKCHKRIGIPCEGSENDRWIDEIFEYDYDFKVVSIQHWLCDECYQGLFHAHQHTWAFQTIDRRFRLPGWYR